MMGCRALALFLVLSLSAPVFSSPASPQAGSVVLSPAEAASISSALEKSEAALKASSELIKTQSRQIVTLSIFCGVLAIALAADGGTRLVEAVRR
jgi:hypothetical protein